MTEKSPVVMVSWPTPKFAMLKNTKKWRALVSPLERHTGAVVVALHIFIIIYNRTIICNFVFLEFDKPKNMGLVAMHPLFYYLDCSFIYSQVESHLRFRVSQGLILARLHCWKPGNIPLTQTVQDDSYREFEFLFCSIFLPLNLRSLVYTRAIIYWSKWRKILDEFG